MADYTVKRIDAMDAAFGGAFKRARAELGVEAFGMQVLDLPPNLEAYPEHDHSESGQEEVYLLLRGSAEIDVDAERIPLDTETMIKVDPGARRKIYTGDEAVRGAPIDVSVGAARSARAKLAETIPGGRAPRSSGTRARGRRADGSGSSGSITTSSSPVALEASTPAFAHTSPWWVSQIRTPRPAR